MNEKNSISALDSCGKIPEFKYCAANIETL